MSALSSIVFILGQFLDELPQCDTIIGSYSTGAYNSTATIDTICLNRSFPHPLLALLLGKFGCVGHCQSQPPFNVVSHINCKVVYAPVDKFPCFFAFHMFSL